MSKEELLKYLIAEIDLIMHDKDYRFENANGTWYSRESCRDLPNEEVFEELRTELRQFADLEAKLAEKDKEIEKLKIILNMQAVQVSEEQRLSLINTNCIQYNQNQKAIELLQELLQTTQPLNLMVKSGHYVNQKQVNVVFEDVIMQKISELKGDENEKEN